MEPNKNKISLPTYIIFLILMIVVIVIVVIVLNNKPNSITPSSEYNKYYTVLYRGSYNNHLSFEDLDYKIVQNTTELDSIYSNISSSDYKDIFNDNFFENYNVLVVSAGIDSEMHSLNITNKKVTATVYHASPLSAADELFEYTAFFIPISKTVDTVDLTNNTYPDRMY